MFFFQALVSDATWNQLRTRRWLLCKVQVIITPPCCQESEKSWFFVFSCNFPPKVILFQQFEGFKFRIANLRFAVCHFQKFFFPPEIEPVAFRELGRFDCSVQCRVLGQWGWNPFNGYHVTACLCFWCLILSSKNAFEYETHKPILKQFDCNRHRTGDLLRVKANVISITPWNLKIVIARPWFLCIFSDFFGS